MEEFRKPLEILYSLELSLPAKDPYFGELWFQDQFKRLAAKNLTVKVVNDLSTAAFSKWFTEGITAARW